MQTDVLRTEQINLRLSTDEVARLLRLAAHYAISPQSVLRMILKRAVDELEGVHPKPKKKERSAAGEVAPRRASGRGRGQPQGE
jgi:hypothetical protein